MTSHAIKLLAAAHFETVSRYYFFPSTQGLGAGRTLVGRVGVVTAVREEVGQGGVRRGRALYLRWNA